MKYVDMNGVELKAGMYVKFEGDSPNLVVDVKPDENIKANLGLDATNYKFYENRHNKLNRDFERYNSDPKLITPYKPKVEEVYPFDEFTLAKTDTPDVFMLCDFAVCEAPEGSELPDGVFLK